MMIYYGSCYCGCIKFEVDGMIDLVLFCNCLICQCKGLLLWFVLCDVLCLQIFESDKIIYIFNYYVIQYYFCLICGIYFYGEGKGLNGVVMVVINICCIEGIDFVVVLVMQFDGRLKQF